MADAQGDVRDGVMVESIYQTLLEAATPRAAVKVFAQYAAEVDLLLTDLVMPEMSGPALADRLVSTQPRLRVLFISGYVASGLPFDPDSPNMSFLSKPFQASALIGKVWEVLMRPRTNA